MSRGIFILGTVEVRHGSRRINLGGSKRRALLADLAVHQGQTVTVDQLIDDLWGDQPPVTAAKMVQILVSRLRRDLGSGSDLQPRLETDRGGYRLLVDGASLDLVRFERLIAEADRVLAANPASAVDTYRAALDLWRGAALADVREPFAVAAAARLEELRFRAIEQWSRAALVAGRHAEVIAALTAAVEAEPLREGLQAVLMQVLYQSGRQAEALDRYLQLRRYLAEELGIEPSEELHSLQLRILNHDPTLDPRASATSTLASGVHAGRATSRDEHRPDQSVDRSRIARGARVALGAAAVGIGVAAVVFGVRVLGPASGRASVVVQADSLVMFDPASEAVQADVPVGGMPAVVTVDPSNVWVADSTDRTLLQIDRSTGNVIRTFGLTGSPADLVEGDGFVWVANAFSGTITRVSIAASQESGAFFPADRVTGLVALATAPDILWAALPDAKLVELDPRSAQPRTSLPMPQRGSAICAVGSRIWLLGFASSTAIGLDAGAVASSIQVSLPGDGVAIAPSPGGVWFATSASDGLTELDPTTGRVLQEVSLPGAPVALAATATSVWVALRSGAIERVDPTGGPARTYDLGRPVIALAAMGNGIWATVR